MLAFLCGFANGAVLITQDPSIRAAVTTFARDAASGLVMVLLGGLNALAEAMQRALGAMEEPGGQAA